MSDRLLYLPLGGAGEIGMNCYAYGYGPVGQERFVVVDLGVTFPSMDGTPGVDLIFADVQWLEERKDRIDAIFITHAHEDHVGAVGHLWPRLDAPIYARAFTAHIARLKFEEHGHDELQIRTVAAWPETVAAGPFTVGFLPVSHSIPESSALVIDSPAGRVIHTGDFKLDENPVVGEPFDRELWESVSAQGVKALVCDSTNVFSPHPGRSESEVVGPITELVASLDGLVAATTFASNIARVRTLAEAGTKAGRSVVLLGRAMRRMITAAIETGIINDFPKTVAPENAADIPHENLMLLTTGSQGEHRAATAQLSRGKYLGLKLAEGDTVIFSSKTIPGNEISVARILNNFSEMGVDTITGRDEYHVSGHANRPDLALLHEIVRPDVVVPMHGEHRHLREHAKLAAEGGFRAIVAPNGVGVDLAGEAPRVSEYVETGRTYLDGSVQIGALDGIVRDRVRMSMNGLVVATVIIEDDEPLGDCWCELRGLPEAGLSRAPLVDVLEEDVNQFLMRAGKKTLSDEDRLEEEMRRIIRKTVQDEVGKKPEVQIVISRLSS
ncbi:ribonuclease J [Celeribacter indicus]|uniref:Ribonuclease n=1 Tax=Celeribacter indicus TaxID=1208324 RepID=A0A0B5E562_9RHOB|nr:ribonuclease J [Celeribacter indicus]AJE48141.1 ribonuclease [Celeribacter indicus]SDW33621.1 ribonuclease J [Celeribacter indicus]